MTVDNYTTYAFGYVEPMIDEMRAEDKVMTLAESKYSRLFDTAHIHFAFTDTTKTMKATDSDGGQIEKKFYGEVDELGLACGLGETSYLGGKETYKGYFFNDAWEGIGK